jgi:tetratricopeptide (TPR) repeat protein
LKWLRHFDEAEKFYRSAQAMFPGNVELWKEMGNVYYQQKRFGEAYSYYSGKALNDSDKTAQNNAAFIQRLKKDGEANEWTIASLRRMRNLKDARTLVEAVLAERGDKANFLSEKAVIDFTERKYDSAIKFFDRALRINEYYDFAKQWRAASYRKKPDLDKAKIEIQKALAKLPAATGLSEERAWLAFDQGNLELAGEYFATAAKLDPYLIQRQFSRIEVFARLNQWDDAMDLFDELEKQFPNDAEVAEQKCWFYLRCGRLSDAKDHLEGVEEQHGDNVLIVNAQGGYELEQRNYAAAEKLFRRAIEKVNYEPQYHINLAWALLRQVKDPGEMPRAERPKREKLIDEARRSCRRALKFDPYSAKANGCLGVIAYKRNAFLDAEAYFRKSIELSPPEGNYVELAALYCQMGRYEEATTNLTTAIKFNRNDARAYIELGNVSVLAQNNNEAVRQCRAAIIVEPNNSEAHRALAIALMRSEKYDEAETTLRKALNTVAPHCQSQLYLLLSQILIRSGDLANKEQKKKDFDLYDEALKYVKAAKQDTFTANADIFFHAGVVHYKLEDYRASQENFAACFKANSDRAEAQRYSRVVQAVLDQEKRLFKVNRLYGYMLAGVCVLMLAGLWVPYYAGLKRTILVTAPATANSAAEPAKKREPQDEFMVDRSLLTVMTPILLGLLVVAALLPNVNKLKLPGGFEAEISEPKAAESNIASGPRGEIGFGSSLPVVSPEPR